MYVIEREYGNDMKPRRKKERNDREEWTRVRLGVEARKHEEGNVPGFVEFTGLRAAATPSLKATACWPRDDGRLE